MAEQEEEITTLDVLILLNNFLRQTPFRIVGPTSAEGFADHTRVEIALKIEHNEVRLLMNGNQQQEWPVIQKSEAVKLLTNNVGLVDSMVAEIENTMGMGFQMSDEDGNITYTSPKAAEALEEVEDVQDDQPTEIAQEHEEEAEPTPVMITVPKVVHKKKVETPTEIEKEAPKEVQVAHPVLSPEVIAEEVTDRTQEQPKTVMAVKKLHLFSSDDEDEDE